MDEFSVPNPDHSLEPYSPIDKPSAPESGVSDELTFWGKIGDLWRTTKEDYRSTNFAGKLLLGSLVTMTGYEWGPGNESLTPNIVSRAVDSTDGVKGVVITAAVGFGFTYLQQRTSGLLTRKTAERFPKTSNKLYQMMKNENAEEDTPGLKPFFEQSRASRISSSFLIGSSWNTAREIAITGNTDTRKVEERSALIAASAVGVVAAAFDTLDQVLPDESTGQSIVDFFKTPIPYLLGIIAYFGNEYRKGKKAKA